MRLDSILWLIVFAAGIYIILRRSGQPVESYGRRIRIWETNCGRDAGWIIERRGETIAILTDVRWEDMFWQSYRMEIVTTDPELRERMLTPAYWNLAEVEGLIWRSREGGELAKNAYPAIPPFPEPGRLKMRGLYLSIGHPLPWDDVVMWLRRRRQGNDKPRAHP